MTPYPFTRPHKTRRAQLLWGPQPIRLPFYELAVAAMHLGEMLALCTTRGRLTGLPVDMRPRVAVVTVDRVTAYANEHEVLCGAVFQGVAEAVQAFVAQPPGWKNHTEWPASTEAVTYSPTRNQRGAA